MNKTLKKLLALFLASILIVSLVACNNGGDTDADTSTNTSTNVSDDAGATDDNTDPEVPAKDVLNVAVSLDSGTLDPLGMTGTGGFLNVQRTYMEPLYDYHADGTRFWILATGLERISDIQYTLTLRDDVTFSNGNALTSADVLFSMITNRDDPQMALNVKAVDFDKTAIIDDYTIDLWYTGFNAAQEIGMSSMMILNAETYNPEDMSMDPVGTGPYIVTDYVVNSHVTVELRDGYWGPEPAIKTINFKTLNEESQRVNALETGDVDMATIPIKDVEFVESLGNYTVASTNTGMYYVTDFNMTEGAPLDSKEARWAVSYAIDRQAIVDIVFTGLSSVLHWPASETLVDLESRFLDMHDTYTIGYDPVKAQELADQSGLTGKTLRIITNGAADYITMAQIIQNGLSEIGVNSEIINYDQATYFGILMDANNFDIAVFTPTAPSLMAADIFGMYLTFIPLGWEGPEHDEYMALGAQGLATFDVTERGNIIFDYMKIFVEETPWYGLCEGPVMNAFAKDLQDVEYTLAGSALYQFYSFAS